jgi:hypothetical protein
MISARAQSERRRWSIMLDGSHGLTVKYVFVLDLPFITVTLSYSFTEFYMGAHASRVTNANELIKLFKKDRQQN